MEGSKNKYVYNNFHYVWKQDYATAKEYICCEKRKKQKINCRAKLKHYTREGIWVSIGQHCHAPPGLCQPQARLHTNRTTELTNWKSNAHDNNDSQPNESNTKRLMDLQELYTQPELALTLDGQPYVRCVKLFPEFLVIYASPRQLDVLNRVKDHDQIFFTTFEDACPKGVSLISILVKTQDHDPYPVLSAFVQSNESVVYGKLWSKVLKLCPKLKERNKIFIMADFDIVMHNAIRTVLPNAELVGCSLLWRQFINPIEHYTRLIHSWFRDRPSLKGHNDSSKG